MAECSLNSWVHMNAVPMGDEIVGHCPPSSTGYVMGLDGGGTKTVCAIVDVSGKVVGYGRGGAANINFVEPEVAIASFEKAIKEAMESLAEARYGTLPALLAICAASPTPQEIYLQALQKIVPIKGRLILTGEADVALASAQSSTWGMVILAGTGSFAWFRGRDGRTHSVGGWGSVLGDEGSAYWIGLEGLRASIRGYDGRGQKTRLTQAILGYFELNDIRRLIWEAYWGRLKQRHQVAEISRVVAREALEGDPVASEILHRAAQELALSASACARHLGVENDAFPCVLSGGVFESGDLIIGPLRKFLNEYLPNATVITAKVEQVAGACAIALRESAIAVDEALLGKLHDEITEARERYLRKT